jgi:hypothetical protein
MTDINNQPVRVVVHPSQFPEAVELALRASLRTRRMNHKFHYDTPKQTLRWLRLHEALSPARTDPDCLRIYESASEECSRHLSERPAVEVVSLGCGGGQKDVQLLRLLSARVPRPRLRYVPTDVSAGLTLAARHAALGIGLADADIAPFVIDLAQVHDWNSALVSARTGLDSGEATPKELNARVICFFGMLPNFSPAAVLPQLSALVRPGDCLLLSANLAPGTDYSAATQQVMPLYDNDLTRDWLWTVLCDLGIDRAAGEMEFSIVPCPEQSGLLRIEANVVFRQPRQIECGGERFEYAPNDRFHLFFSYRHTPELLAALLTPHGLVIEQSWINRSGEEGVFLCGRAVECADRSRMAGGTAL